VFIGGSCLSESTDIRSMVFGTDSVLFLSYWGRVKPPAASPGLALCVPRPAAFDNSLSRTEFREARGASRGNACLDSKNEVPLSLRFGLQGTGLFLTGMGEASPSKRAARRSIVWCSLVTSGPRLAVGLGEKGATWNTPLVRSLLPLGFQATSPLTSEGVPMPASDLRKQA
jgi:hypothetical protein